jgi:hypothetical protein
MLDHAPDLDRRSRVVAKLAFRERVRLGKRGAHAMHQPERNGDEPHQHKIRSVPYHAARARRVSAAGRAPISGEVVTEFQSHSSWTDSAVRILYAQPGSQVSVSQHVNSAQNGAAPRHFADMARSPCAESCDGSAIPAPCLQRPFLVSPPVSEAQFWCLVFDGRLNDPDGGRRTQIVLDLAVPRNNVRAFGTATRARVQCGQADARGSKSVVREDDIQSRSTRTAPPWTPLPVPIRIA